LPKRRAKTFAVGELTVNICMDTQLTVADLASIKNLIDAACARGAFKANEMRAVGEVYDKLSAFLAQLQQPPASTSESTDQAPTQGEENA
jgi:hypothetical protein